MCSCLIKKNLLHSVTFPGSLCATTLHRQYEYNSCYIHIYDCCSVVWTSLLDDTTNETANDQRSVLSLVGQD